MKKANAIFVLSLVALLAPLYAHAAPAGSTPPVPVSFGPNIRVTGDGYSAGFQQAETTIAVNARDPLNMVMGFFDRQPTPAVRTCGNAFTFDGGRSWTLGNGPAKESSADDCGDPSIAADADGNFYYAFLDGRVSAGGFIDGFDVVVARSTDGGVTFPTFSVAFREPPDFTGLSPDKELIAVDNRPASPFIGNIYLSWTAFGPEGIQIVVQVSRDRGASWSEPAPISRLVSYTLPEEVQGSFSIVAPDGTAYVFYSDSSWATLREDIKFVKSADGGRTWSRPVNALSNLPAPSQFVLKNADRSFGQEENVGIISNAFPSVAIGPGGAIYLAWADFSAGSCTFLAVGRNPCVNSDVRLSVSRNGGKSWSAPLKVTDEKNATDQFMPTLSVNPDGLLSIMWLDKRLDADNENYDVFYTNTADGKTFLRNVRVTSETSVIGKYNWAGDYNGMAAISGAVVPAWGDHRMPSSLDVFSARGTLRTP